MNDSLKTKQFLILLFLTLVLPVFGNIDMKKVDSLNKVISTQTGRERIETLILLSDIYRKLSPDQSFKTDTMAINYADQEGLENMKGVILLSMGKTANVSGDYALAIDYFEKAVKALEKTANNTDLCRTYINLGIVHKNKGDFEEAIKNFDFASEIAAQNGLKDQLAASLTNRAIVDFSAGNFNDAADNYQKAMKIYEELNDSTRYAILTMNLGLVYWQWNKNDLALEMLLKAKDVLEKTNQMSELGKLYNNLGRLYSQDLQNNEEALKYYQRSLEIRELIGNQLGIAVVLANMGRIYSDMQQSEKAIDHLIRSQRISKTIGYKEGEALAFYYLGLVYKSDREFTRSNSYMDSALMIASKHGFSSYFRLVNEAKLTNFFRLRDDSAFIKEYAVFAYSYDSTINRLSELKYDLISIQNELSAAENENLSLRQNISEQSVKLKGYRVATLVLLLFLVVTLFLWIKKQKV